MIFLNYTQLRENEESFEFCEEPSAGGVDGSCECGVVVS